jgi:Ni,Fe-hydrogenase maturation factor
MNDEKEKITVFVFGNIDINIDALPLKILPKLKQQFPDIFFQLKDPHEDFELPEKVILIDTVVGLKEPRMFHSLEEFEAPPHVTLHDFDLFSYLHLLKKVGKLPKKIKIIAIPATISEQETLEFVAKSLE